MRVIVDFHTAEGDTIWALRSHVRDEFVLDDFGAGSVVTLSDGEGHSAEGVIESVDQGGLLSIMIIWETWRDDSAFGRSDGLSFTPLAPQFTSASGPRVLVDA